jgi:hypothetical protein
VSIIRNVYISVLIYVVSLALHLPIPLYIHNWCQDIYLTSPVYFMRGGRWCVVPNQRIHVDVVMQSCLGFDIGQDVLGGALAYRLQEKCAKSDQDKLNYIWFIVAWYGKHTKGLHVHALLVKHNKKLDERKLKELYRKRWPLLKAQADTTRGSWLLDDTTVLETTIKVMHKGHRWDIFISGRINCHIKREILFNKR